MSDPRKFFNSVDDDSSAVFVIIDEEHSIMEIYGKDELKLACYEVSSYISQRYFELNLGNTEGENKPEGTKCWLPYLPPYGIQGMGITGIDIYWNRVMRAVVQPSGRSMGYESPR